MEEKVYLRTVSKTGLALRVIDRKNVERFFTAKEMADLQDHLNWVQCDRCGKWRVLFNADPEEELPENWYCEMNTDAQNNSCDEPERSQAWYEMEESRLTAFVSGQACHSLVTEAPEGLSNEDEDRLRQNDQFLDHLLDVCPTGKQTKMVANHVFHDILVKPTDEQLKRSTPQKLAKATSPPEPSGDEWISPNGKKRVASPLASPNPTQRPRVLGVSQFSEEKINISEGPSKRNGMDYADSRSPARIQGTSRTRRSPVKQMMQTSPEAQQTIDTTDSQSTATLCSRRSSRVRQEPKRFCPGDAQTKEASGKPRNPRVSKSGPTRKNGQNKHQTNAEQNHGKTDLICTLDQNDSLGRGCTEAACESTGNLKTQTDSVRRSVPLEEHATGSVGKRRKKTFARKSVLGEGIAQGGTNHGTIVPTPTKENKCPRPSIEIIDLSLDDD